VLNAFHSLYDAIETQLGQHVIDWYGKGELATILAIRNARHHNKANKIRTLYTCYARGSWRPDRMRQYVLIDFNSPEEGADTFDVYLSWADLEMLLSMPRSESRMREASCKIIHKYLGTAKYEAYASYYGLGKDRVFFNIVPLIVNAATIITPLIKPYLTNLSTESETFATLFEYDTCGHQTSGGGLRAFCFAILIITIAAHPSAHQQRVWTAPGVQGVDRKNSDAVRLRSCVRPHMRAPSSSYFFIAGSCEGERGGAVWFCPRRSSRYGRALPCKPHIRREDVPTTVPHSGQESSKRAAPLCETAPSCQAGQRRRPLGIRMPRRRVAVRGLIVKQISRQAS
jgi:hypothetical protein